MKDSVSKLPSISRALPVLEGITSPRTGENVGCHDMFGAHAQSQPAPGAYILYIYDVFNCHVCFYILRLVEILPFQFTAVFHPP